MNGKWMCQLCGYMENERSIQIQNEYFLCLTCADSYSNRELKDKLQGK